MDDRIAYYEMIPTLIAAFAAYGIGGIISFLGGVHLWLCLKARSFLSVDGVITHSEVIKRKTGRKGVFAYDVEIRFEYEVDGELYTEGKYHMVPVGYTWARLSKSAIVRRHPVGSHVVAWYDPNDPETAVLDRSIKVVPVLLLLVSLLFMGVFTTDLIGITHLFENRAP